VTSFDAPPDTTWVISEAEDRVGNHSTGLWWWNLCDRFTIQVFAPYALLRVGSWLRPFKGHCKPKAMRDEGVINVAGHPQLNRRCTRHPGCFHSPKRNLNYGFKGMM